MSALVGNVAALHAFLQAADGLPAPDSVSVYDFDEAAHLGFRSLEDLRAWAGYLQVDVAAHEVEAYRQVHHNADAVWTPHQGEPVTLRMVHVEKLPEPMPAFEYTCERCGATFGAVGGFYGNEDDESARQYDQDEVARHEAGECVGVTV